MNRPIYDAQLCDAKFRFFYDGGITYIANLIRSETELTEGTREFIADVMEGKVKLKRGRVTTFYRDIQVFLMFEIKLIEGSNFLDAGAIVGNCFGIEQDAAIKAYQRVKPWMEQQRALEIEEREGRARDIEKI